MNASVWVRIGKIADVSRMGVSVRRSMCLDEFEELGMQARLWVQDVT